MIPLVPDDEYQARYGTYWDVCGSKKPYDTAAQAKQAAKSMMTNKPGIPAQHKYHCPYCKKYHVGRKSPKKRTNYGNTRANRNSDT